LDISRQLERAGYTERQAAFDLWRKEFNEERPHEALGMRFPSEVYRDSERKYEGAPGKASVSRDRESPGETQRDDQL
jgi:transposase InsO family protein